MLSTRIFMWIVESFSRVSALTGSGSEGDMILYVYAYRVFFITRVASLRGVCSTSRNSCDFWHLHGGFAGLGWTLADEAATLQKRGCSVRKQSLIRASTDSHRRTDSIGCHLMVVRYLFGIAKTICYSVSRQSLTAVTGICNVSGFC